MKTKILFVIDNLQFGGGERVFSQIINTLNPDRYKIFVTSFPDGPFSEAITNQHVEYLPLNFSKRFNPRLLFQIKNIIKLNHIQIVHGQGSRAEFYARIAHRLAGNSKYISTVAMPVEGFDVGIWRKKIYRLFDKISEEFVDEFIAVSDSLKNILIYERGTNPGKVLRIHNGIELDKYSEEDGNSRSTIRKEFSVGDEELLIGAIGRLVWQKGFEYLIRAIPAIIRKYPNTKFIVVGDGQLENRLKAQSSRLKVSDHLVFPGFRSDIKEILSAIDILVISSLLEGFPMVTLEAMAMAKPIIATNISGIDEQIVDEESGLLIPFQDPDAISKAVLRLIRDKRLARELGENAENRVAKLFSVSKMIRETEKIYHSIIQ